MNEDAVPGRQLVTVAEPAGEAPGALITPEMRLELMAARLEGLASQNRRLTHDNDDLRQENRHLLASASQLRGENVALARVLAPAEATAQELDRLARQLEAFGQAMQAREQAVERLAAELPVLARAAAAQAVQAVGRVPATLSPDSIDRLVEALTRRAQDASQNEAATMLQAMQRSTSWRVTKPIRAAGRILGKS